MVSVGEETRPGCELQQCSAAMGASRLTICLGLKRRHVVEFLDLPSEILSRILLHLDSSSLTACIHVNPVLENIICDQYFLDAYTRRTLGLSDRGADSDVKFKDVPGVTSRLMELWFLTHNVLASLHHGPRACTKRDSLFFRLSCFQHSLKSWLAQSMTSGTPFLSSVNCSSYWPTSLFSESVNSLPAFVTEPLTKLALGFHDLVEGTILADHLSLHEGIPKTLHHVWHDGLPVDVKDNFKCQYCMEIVCGQTVESSFYLSAIMICFSADSCVLWTGCVGQFPGCSYEKTLNLVSFPTSSSYTSIKTSCVHISELLTRHTVTDENPNGQWKRQKLYPGLCYHLNHFNKNVIISSLPLRIHNSLYPSNNPLSTEDLTEPRSGCTRDFTLRLSQHSAIRETVNGKFLFYHGSLLVCNLKRSPATQKCRHVQGWPYHREARESQNISSRNFSNECNHTQQPPRHCRHDKQNKEVVLDFHNQPHNAGTHESVSGHKLPNTEHGNAQEGRLMLRIGAIFRQEILRYACDPDSHQVLCSTCSKLWFPSPESLAKCIDQIRSKDFVPTEFWPFHILVEAFEILTEMCR